MQYVIIGNSIAGVAAAKAIRKNDTKGQIIIIGDEGCHAYARPLISYYLNGKTDLKKMEYCDPDFYSENNILLLNQTAVKIDKDNKEVLLGNNEKVKYDKLLIATGSSPFIPNTKGYEKIKNKFTFLKVSDALEIEKIIKKDSRVLIVGAGLIGLKCAEGISEKVKNISIVDMAPQVLASILDEKGSKIIEKHLKKFNVDLFLNDCVEEYTENSARLKSGKVIEFDVLVTAVGVRPNTAIFSEAGGEINRGIVVDNRMQTSISDVYSAGDCSEGYDCIKEEKRILALLPNANMQGECAGENMSGNICEFEKGMPVNAIGIFGLHIATAGIYEGKSKTTVDNNTYKRLFYDKNRLLGYIIIGDVTRSGIYTGIIKEKRDLKSLDFEELVETPSMTVFSKDVREEMLGGVNNE